MAAVEHEHAPRSDSRCAAVSDGLFQVVNRTCSTARDHWDADLVGNAAEQRNVESLHGPVAINVVYEQLANSELHEASRMLDGREFRIDRSRSDHGAVSPEHRPLHIDGANDGLAPILRHGGPNDLWHFNGCRVDDHFLDPRADEAPDVIQCSHNTVPSHMRDPQSRLRWQATNIHRQPPEATLCAFLT